MRLTKKAMARVIVQALYNLPRLPAEDDRRVLKMERAPADRLRERHRLACNILLQVKRIVLPVDEPAPGQGWFLAGGNHEINVWETPD